MHDQDLAIVKGLVSVAWADGKIAAEEMEIIDALLAAYAATPSEAHEIRSYAQTPRTIEEIPLTDLSAEDRRVLLHHAVLLTYSDGDQSDSEREVLQKLVEQLRLPEGDAKAICAAAEQHAKESLHLLGSA